MAVILSQCQDVYSADVPVAIQGLARSVVASGLEDKFLSGDDQVFVIEKFLHFFSIKIVMIQMFLMELIWLDRLTNTHVCSCLKGQTRIMIYQSI